MKRREGLLLVLAVWAVVVAFICILSFWVEDGDASTSSWFRVTAYCLQGHTATGTYVHPGTIAVDPRLIRLGRRLYVPGYGRGRAEDTGSAVRGHHIDVWMGSCSAARRWGVRRLRVRVS